MLFFTFYGLLLMNVIAFFAYGLDKLKAVRHWRRIPEALLLLLSFLGGSIGSLMAMSLFRHKTQKPLFRIMVPLFLCLHLILLGWLGYHWFEHV